MITPERGRVSSFTLNRRGTFQMILTFGNNHCGTVPNLKVNYSLSVTCTPDSLDSRGFLFDQVEVDRYFQSLRQTDLSCEQFCIACGRDLYKQIYRSNPACKIQRFALTLSPFPHQADLTFEYGNES